METWMPVLSVAHRIGIALAVGGATVKLALLLRGRSDRSIDGHFLGVTGTVSALIGAGMVLATLSGIGWLALGYPLSSLLVVKIALVASIWVIGPVIDKVIEPRFRRLSEASGEGASTELLRVRGRLLVLEIVATGLLFFVVILWTLR